MLTMVLMGAVIAATGQPARGSKNDNRGYKNDKGRDVVMEKKKDYRDNIRYKNGERPVKREDIRDYKYHEARKKQEVNRYHVNKAPHRHEIPAHFRGNSHYRYIPAYGHTVRYFPSSPVVFKAKNTKYYMYSGHFYRYHKGIGYIWVENPYGLVINHLPHGAVMVRINGVPHFRLGNVYFTVHPHGYEVVALPARYYSRPMIHVSASF